MARALSTAAAALVLCGTLLMIATSVQAYASLLLRGYTMDTGESLGVGSYKFTIQDDCNLVLSKNKGTSIWSTNTGGDFIGCHLIFQEDGNIVIYNLDGESVWNAGTNGRNGAYIVTQCDGNVVMYTSTGTPVWATGTNGKVEAIDLDEGNRLRKPSTGTLFVQTVPEASA